MKFAIVADDDTGASDAASMLTDKGVRTLLLLDRRLLEEDPAAAESFQAMVVGIQSRSIEPERARRRTRAAVEALTALEPRKLQIKYCSTFDSTPEGNIGPSLDAALDCLGQRATIVCPALPVNGRTTYCGYHFVNGVPLSESPLRHHPLNPMTDANLVRWLEHQTNRQVASVNLRQVREGVQELRGHMEALVADGAAYLVTDATQQSDLTAIAEATREWPLVSGGSGITAEIPRFLFPDTAPLSFSDRIARLEGPTLVIAGSTSPATRAQDEFALAHGFRRLTVDPFAILEEEFDPKAAAEEGLNHLEEGAHLVVRAGSGPESGVAPVQEHGRGVGLSETEVGLRIGRALASVAGRLIGSGAVGRLILSGGETAGTVCRGLDIRALEVGPPIEPGVPYCFPLSGPDLLVVLKSGNFGSEEFYLRVCRLSG